MRKEFIQIALLGVLTSFVFAEPPAYGANSEDFDINSISSFLDDDTSASSVSGKAAPYNYNSFTPSAAGSYKGGSSSYPVVQKDHATSSSAGSYGGVGNPYSPAEPHSLPHYSTPYNPNYEGYRGSLGSYGSESHSTSFSFPPGGSHSSSPQGITDPKGPGSSVPGLHGSGSVSSPYGGASSHSSATHGPVSLVPIGHSPSPHGAPGHPPHGPPTFGPSTAGHSQVGPYNGYSPYASSSSFNALHPGSAPGSYSPYTFEKPSHVEGLGPNDYKGSPYPGSYSGYASPYAGGPYAHSGSYSSSGPVQFGLGPKTPYTSPYKPGSYYSSRPYSSVLSPYKRPNSYESIPPWKYSPDSSRYPSYSGKYTGSPSSSRPIYSSPPSVYSRRPYVYPGNYKGSSSKPTSAFAFTDLF